MATVRIYKIYGTAGSTTSNVANIQIQRDCVVFGIQYSIRVDAVADNSVAVCELSLASTSLIGSNDVSGSIAEFGGFANLVTSGMTFPGLVGMLNGIQIPLRVQDKLYLHMNITTATIYATFHVYVMER